MNLFTFAKASSAHEEHPERNEDCTSIDPQTGLAIVCDGVGSAYGAGQAARLAARTIKKRWQQLYAEHIQSGTQEREPPLDEFVYELLEEANLAVLALRQRLTKKLGERKVAYAQTTLVLALIYPHQDRYLLTYAHVGDSRAYLLRQQTSLERLTIDDGYYLLLLNRDQISAEDATRIDQATSVEQLTEKEFEHFSRRNGITQALGDPQITIHIGQTEMSPGDRLLLCTDGIHDNLTDSEIAEILQKGARTTVAKALVKKAQVYAQRDVVPYIRAKKDDMSAVVVTCHRGVPE
jgi:protein phosphatase